MSGRREPDALDAARVTALVLASVALAGTLRGVPAGLRTALLQAAFFAVPFAYARAAGLRPLADAGFGPLRARDLLLTAAASMASLWILKGLQDVQLDVFRRLGMEDQTLLETRKIERTVARARELLGLAGLSLFAVFPPLCEEMCFRGLALRGFARDFGPFRAVLYTALLFAAMHGSLVQLLLMGFLGLYFGALAWLTGSLWPSILAHAINNGAVLVLTVGWGPAVQGFRAPWPLTALSAAVFGGVLLLMGLDRRARDQARGLGSPGA